MDWEYLTHRHNRKQWLMIVVDLLMLAGCLLAALYFRLSPDQWQYGWSEALCQGLTAITSLFIFLRLGLYRSVIRYMGQQAIYAVLRGVSASALVLAIASFITNAFIPRSVPFIYWGFALLCVGGSRLLIRSYYQSLLQIHKKRVAIYGAGTSGLQIYKALMHGHEYKPVVFFDDSHAKQGTLIDGLTVKPASEIATQVFEKGIDRVLIAMPSMPLVRRKQITKQLESQGINVQMVPGLEELVSGSVPLAQPQAVYEDILGRPQVRPKQSLLCQCITDKVVLVTGAGGSIGSELCRQIVAIRPQMIVILDASEYALYQIEKELRELIAQQPTPEVILHACLGNVQERALMSELIQRFGVQTIYHSAAYKHVPIVESNVIEGVRNNVMGTKVAAEVAEQYGVETFVLISTDKAVRPTNVMGASKRMAELILQAHAKVAKNTRFSMVRFGNVLGSSGSVIPLFREQVHAGGPVTVTHPDITRYFMTIPEAAQLVLQAGSMGQGGDVFVLDMGEPVKIDELARRIISLMGYELKEVDNPNGDIEIVYTGLRPGEKLFEELLLGSNVVETDHPKICRAMEKTLPMAKLDTLLQQIDEGCQSRNVVTVVAALKQAVCGFTPSCEWSLNLVEVAGEQEADNEAGNNVEWLGGIKSKVS